MSKHDDFNLDPISKEPGSHPLGTGVGSASGAVAGAAVGLMAGPVGALVGGVAGAVVGGLGGHAAAEAVNPTDEDAYWQGHYTREEYYEEGRPYGDYAPAYRLGVFGYTEYNETFEQAESRLASHWDHKKEQSTLSWQQAKAASQAAWNRLHSQQGDRPLPQDGFAGEPYLEKGDTAHTLNNLLEICRDGEYGFRECAEHTQAADLKAVLGSRANDCANSAAELMSLIRDFDSTPEEGGTVSGAMHRGWVSVKGTLSGYSDYAMLDECERGEDAALAQYRKAMKQNLPPAARLVVERQSKGVQRNHDQVKALRDALKSAK